MQLAVICNHGQLWGRVGIALGCNFNFCIVPAFGGKCQGFVLYMQENSSATCLKCPLGDVAIYRDGLDCSGENRHSFTNWLSTQHGAFSRDLLDVKSKTHTAWGF